MRNLKKLLALVLAMVMAFSLMLTANAAVKYDDYQDKDSITAEFDEGVRVLTGLEVMQGDEKGFRPSDKITRAEAAAVIYRAVTGDVTDRQTALYKDYGTFTDVKSDDWFAGYVGYCQNAGYIKGTSPTTFQPYGQVTGYEVLAMILRAVGYGKNNEFTGGSWQVNVAALAKQLGVTRNVVAAHMDQTLNMAAPREVVADLIFMTIATVPTVTYTPALAYNDKQAILSNKFNPTLGQQVFGLYWGEWTSIDMWGRPGYKWYSGGIDSGSVTRTSNSASYAKGTAYVIPDNHPIYAKDSAKDEVVVATIGAKATKEYQVTTLECDVAHDLEIKNEETFVLYVNGDHNLTRSGIQPVTETYKIVATDTVTKVGGQGRLSEFYYNETSPWAGDLADRVVMIDTMLAQVTNVTPVKLDVNNHVITPAKMEVTIYDGGVTNAPAGNNGNSKRIISKPSSSKDNWEYGKGDMILIHAYTNKGARNETPVNNTKLEAAAFETDPVIGTDSPTTTLKEGDTVKVEKKADSITGKQTTAYWNANKHQIDGKDYNDQLELFLDRAKQATNTTFTWWMDLYGNVIGITDSQATFGVITSIYASISQGEADTTGRVKAMANVKYADGSTGVVAIDKFLMSTTATAANGVATTAGTKSTDENEQLTANKSTVELWPRFESTGTAAYNPAMTVSVPTVNMSASDDALYQGFLYLAPSTVTNNDAHFNKAGKYQQDSYGILYDHMFQFVIASDSSVVAIEVAGSTAPATPNQGLYADKYNNLAGNTANQNGKIFKNLSYMVLNNDNAAAGGTAGSINTVYLDNDTQIMVYNGGTGVSTYNGVGELPGDVTLSLNSEVDWADTDGDGRANYVYVQGEIPGVVTYNLFYNNGGGAQWDGTIGTISGYLDGKAETVTFNNYSLYNTVNNSKNYDAHLFALQITNGIVTNVMQADNEASTNWGQLILANYNSGTPVDQTGVRLKFDTSTTAAPGSVDNIKTVATTPVNFKTGSANGNSYTVSTEAVYWHDSIDVNVAKGLSNVAYERVSQGHKIVVSGATTFVTGGPNTAGANIEYWIAPTCEIIGELEWLNMRECDVTMVYEAGSINSVIQLYITSDPDVTPVDPDANVVKGNRPYGNCVSYPVNGSGLTAALKSGVRDTLLFCSALSDDNTMNGNLGVNGVAPTSLIYFPFTVQAGTVATLEIRDQNGDLVYSENSNTLSNNGLNSSDSGDAHAFVINFKNAASNAGYAPGLPLLITNAKGNSMTYTFTIYTTNASGNVVLSTGSFGMN